MIYDARETKALLTNWLNMELGSFSPIHLSWIEVMLRMAAAVLLPLAIGLDRFVRRKPMDFRPFVIVSAAAASLSLAIMELAHKVGDPQLDFTPGRVFAGIITGIGFLGAGAMFREQNYVKGAGSAASIWAAGAIGILCGLGILWLATILTICVLLTLVVGAPFTERYDTD